MNEEIKKIYQKSSMYTNYEPYESYYKKLPDDIVELSKLVFQQTIHRITLKNAFLDVDSNPIKREYPWEKYRLHDDILLTSPAMTAELFRMDSRGFTLDREIKHKIIVTCRYVSILLASILKAKGIPARCRSGFAGYFYKGIFVDHWIVQYYKESEQRWVNVDADGIYDVDFNQWDMPQKQFSWVAQVWLDVRSGRADVNQYCHGSRVKGLNMLARSLFYDFHSLMGDEISYLFFPTYIDEDKEFYTLPIEDLKELDDLATLMLDPDKNFDELRYLFYNDQKFRIINTPLLSDNDHLEWNKA